MNILFIYPSLNNQPNPPLGVLVLSTVLKKKGHTVKIYDTTFGYSAKELSKLIKSFSPKAVAFSATSSNYSFALEIAKGIKKSFNLPIIFGGPHITLAPEKVILENQVDYLCIGEGEEALPELIECLEKGKTCKTVKNIWGKSFRNPLRNLNQDLDSLPFTDWTFLDKRYRKSFKLNLMTTRGCPFNCTYCSNPSFRKIFAGKGKYVRFMSPRRIVDEIKEARKKIGFESVVFSDDTFTLLKSRVMEFCKLYGAEVGLPFSLLARANCVDWEMLKALKKAGCRSMAIGIESGSDKIRNRVMKRDMSKQTILNAFRNARKAGIKTYAFNMVGLPFETEEDIFETIELNKLCKPDAIQVSIFAPYIGTEARQVCKENNFLRQEPGSDYYTSTVLSQPSISKAKVEALHKTFLLYCFLPKKTFPAINALALALEKTPDKYRSSAGLPFLKLGELIGSVRKKGLRGASDAVLFRLKAQILKKLK